jgi:hypothetical protein
MRRAGCKRDARTVQSLASRDDLKKRQNILEARFLEDSDGNRVTER